MEDFEDSETNDDDGVVGNPSGRWSRHRGLIGQEYLAGTADDRPRAEKMQDLKDAHWALGGNRLVDRVALTNFIEDETLHAGTCALDKFMQFAKDESPDIRFSAALDRVKAQFEAHHSQGLGSVRRRTTASVVCLASVAWVAGRRFSCVPQKSWLPRPLDRSTSFPRTTFSLHTVCSTSAAVLVICTAWLQPWGFPWIARRC